MKREIKFRAWDKQNNCWYKPIHEAYKGNLWELLVNFSGQLDVHSLDKETNNSILIHESRFPDRYELMQFTGLLDKNDKEIYENDIMKFEGHTSFIVFSEVHAGFVFNSYMPKGYIHNLYYVVMEGGEVIGNMYENPELLNI